MFLCKQKINIKKYIIIFMLMLLAVLILPSCKNEEIPETETVEQNESEIDNEEPMPEEYEEL